MNFTFRLPPASEVVPPPTHVHPLPAAQRPIHPLFPKESDADFKKVSSRRRKSFRRSVLHRAAMAAPSHSPPKNCSPHQAAQACVQRPRAASASPVSAKKRPLSDSPTALSPSSLLPLAQRIRSDIQIGESDVESPEKEILRSSPSRASLTVRFTVKNGDPPGAGKIWENRFFTVKIDQMTPKNGQK